MGEEEPPKMKRTAVESLGWLTESSIMPRKHRAIEGVGPSSILDLKATLYKSQEESKRHPKEQIHSADSQYGQHLEVHRAKKIISGHDSFTNKNSGVDSRAAKGSTNMMDSIEDIFESSLKLEETHFKEGYGEGYADGIIPGKEEGRQVGLKTGFEVGEELGFYRGCIDVWTSALRVDPNCFSVRIQKTISKMDELLQGYPVWDPENESVSDTMDSLGLKFRVICATLNLKLAYNGYPKTSGGESIDF